MRGRLKQRTGWFATTPHPAVAYRVDETSRQLNEANSTEESRKPTRFDSFLSSNSSHRQATSALKIQPKKKIQKNPALQRNPQGSPLHKHVRDVHPSNLPNASAGKSNRPICLTRSHQSPAPVLHQSPDPFSSNVVQSPVPSLGSSIIPVSY